jgi:prolyl 4-hydroxylase
VLKYELGQKYNIHHDYGADDVKLACGPRILTFFLYLSGKSIALSVALPFLLCMGFVDVEEGGETAFPHIPLAVKPKKGSAILWPSVLDVNPEAQDGRTMHEAKPVIKGLKFAANSWIHLYSYEKPNLWGCTGAFDEL